LHGLDLHGQQLAGAQLSACGACRVGLDHATAALALRINSFV
jgi:hypothetical protein